MGRVLRAFYQGGQYESAWVVTSPCWALVWSAPCPSGPPSRLGGSLLTEESWGAARSVPCLAWAPAPRSGLRVNASVLLFNGLLCSLALHSQAASSLPSGHMAVINTAGRPPVELDSFPLPQGASRRPKAGRGAVTHLFSVASLTIFLAANPNQLHRCPGVPVSQDPEQPPRVLSCWELRHETEQEGREAGGWAPCTSVGAAPTPQPS